MNCTEKVWDFLAGAKNDNYPGRVQNYHIRQMGTDVGIWGVVIEPPWRVCLMSVVQTHMAVSAVTPDAGICFHW